MKKTFFFLTLMLPVLFFACSKDSGNGNPSADVDCNGVDSRFAAKASPIIQNSCATNSGCHGNGSSNGPGALTNFTQVSAAAAAIKAAVASGRMPKNGSLTGTEKNTIICWVNSGAQNN